MRFRAEIAVPIILILLTSLSSLATLYKNFSLLDIFIIVTTTTYILSSDFTFKSSIVRFSLLAVFTVFAVVFLNLVYFEIFSIELIFSAIQMLFLFTFALIFCVEYVRRYELNDLVLLNNSLFILLTVLLGISHYFLLDLIIFKSDLVSRSIPIISGTSAIFAIAIVSSSHSYIFNRIRLPHFLFMISLGILFALATGQRSLLVSLILVITYVIYKKHKILLALYPFLLYFLLNVFAKARYLSDDHHVFVDISRIGILYDFLFALINSPASIFIGLGVENWLSPRYGQEPHFQFFHLISDYGIFVAIFYSVMVYGFVFQISSREKIISSYAVLLSLGVAPYYFFHTYSLERGNVILFMILSLYLYKKNLKFVKHS